MDELERAMPAWLNNWLNDWAPWRLREMMQIQESAIANLEAQNQRLLEAASRSARAADSRNAQLAQVSAERDAARNERDPALGRIQKMLLTIANLENTNCDLEKDRDRLEKALAESNRSCVQFSEINARLEKRLQASGDDIAFRENIITGQENLVISLEDQLRAANQQVNDQRENNARLYAIIDRIPGTLGSLRSAVLCECSRLSAAVDTGITQALDALK